MRNMGGMANMLSKLPGAGQLPDNVKSQMDDKVLVRMEAIINSMTLKERAKPEIIKGSRKRRIAMGAGMQVQDVNRLLKQFDEMQRMMKKMKKGGMAKMMRGMKGMMPPGFPAADGPPHAECGRFQHSPFAVKTARNLTGCKSCPLRSTL